MISGIGTFGALLGSLVLISTTSWNSLSKLLLDRINLTVVTLSLCPQRIHLSYLSQPLDSLYFHFWNVMILVFYFRRLVLCREYRLGSIRSNLIFPIRCNQDCWIFQDSTKYVDFQRFILLTQRRTL